MPETTDGAGAWTHAAAMAASPKLWAMLHTRWMRRESETRRPPFGPDLQAGFF